MAIPFVEVAFGETLVASCAFLGPYAVPALFAVAAAYGTYQLCTYIDSICYEVQTEEQENPGKRRDDGKRKPRTNPFDCPVDEDVVVVDNEGNAIKVPQGNWLTGTKDGNWIQERAPNGTEKGQATGLRKDGGHNPSPVHTDPRSLEPHAHVPGVVNADGTPWLTIY